MEDERLLHCKMCNLAYLNFDEMQKHVKEVHWEMFHGDAAPKLGEKKAVSKDVNLVKEVPKPFESLLAEKKKEEPMDSSKRQEMIQRHGMLGKLLFGAQISEPDKKLDEAEEVTKKPTIPTEDQPSTSKQDQPSSPSKMGGSKKESEVKYEIDEMWRNLGDDAKVIKILEMQNLITTDILELYEKEEEGGLGRKACKPSGVLLEARGDLFPEKPSDQADDEELSDTTPTTSPSDVQKDISDSEESDQEDEFWREFDEGIDQSGVPLFDPPIRTSSPPRKMARTREILDEKFGDVRNIRVDPFFQYLWNQSFKRKDKDMWRQSKMADVIEAHGWDKRM